MRSHGDRGNEKKQFSNTLHPARPTLPMSRAVGIDLGTTYSAVASLDAQGRSSIVRNENGDILTPSVVWFDDHEIVVGKEAKKVAALHPHQVAECAKRDVGKTAYSKLIRGEQIPPEVIQACILRQLKDDAVAHLGSDIKVVITVPAYFDEPRRKATAHAGEMAGLDVLDIVNEPTAAALSFGESLGYLSPQGEALRPMKVLVYDLGGGTFDVTLIELKPGDVRTLATDGDVRLGGRDWDETLVEHAAQKFQSEHPDTTDPRDDPATLAAVYAAVEEAKHTLSARARTTIPVRHAGKFVEVGVTAEEFQELTEPLLERTVLTTRQVLAAAGVDWPQIDRLLLVGGSTRMPMVAKMLERMSGKVPDRSVHPDEAVARGAAIFAGYLLNQRSSTAAPHVTVAATAAEKIAPTTLGAATAVHPTAFKVTDVNSHSLGIEGVDPATGRKENMVLIPRNSPLPARTVKKCVTRSAAQKSIVLSVLEGESRDPEQCTSIARAVMRSLPDDLPQGSPIEVQYEYGTNGRLSVRAHLPGTNKKMTIDLEHNQGMSEDRVRKWKRVVENKAGFDAFETLLEEVLEEHGLKETPAAAPATVVSANRNRSNPVSTSESNAVSAAPVAKPRNNNPVLATVSKPVVAVAHVHAESSGENAGPGNDSTQFGSTASGPGDVARRRNGPPRSWTVTIVGHVIAPLLGLLLAYYLLCWFTPKGNFLNLPLPGLKSVSDTP